MKILVKILLGILLIPNFTLGNIRGKKNSAKVTIIQPKAQLSKQLLVDYWEEIINSRKFLVSQNKKNKKINLNEGKYTFNLETDSQVTFLYGWHKDATGNIISITQSLITVNSGDSIVISGDSFDEITVKGKGSNKIKAEFERIKNNRTFQNFWWKTLAIKKFNKKSLKNIEMMLNEKYSRSDSLLNLTIEKYKDVLSLEQLKTIELNGLSDNLMDFEKNLSLLVIEKSCDYFIDCHSKDSLRNFVNKMLMAKQLPTGFSDIVKLRSLNYCSYLTQRTARILKFQNKFDYDDLFKDEKGKLKEKLLLNFFMTASRFLNREQLQYSRIRLKQDILNHEYNLELSNSIFKNNDDTSYLGIELKDQHGKIFKLEDLKGKVVFIDYWFTGCGGCVGYYKTVVSKVEKLVDRNKVVFVSISVDKDRSTWIESLKSGQYSSIDNINVQSNLGMMAPIVLSFGVSSFPQPILLDRNGKIYSASKYDLRKNGADGLLTQINKAYFSK